MMSFIVAGIGAGLVSALLFAVVITGSPLAMLLSYAAPLPVFIAALGWRHRAGLVAAIAGALALALLLRYQAAPRLRDRHRLACLGHRLHGLAWPNRRQKHRPNGIPTGRLLLWVVGTSALVTLIGAIAIAGDHEAYRVRHAAFDHRRAVRVRCPDMPPPNLPTGFSVDDVASVLADLGSVPCWRGVRADACRQPVDGGQGGSPVDRLPRPWPFCHRPRTCRMKRSAVTAAALVLAFMPGFFGFFGMAILGALPFPASCSMALPASTRCRWASPCAAGCWSPSISDWLSAGRSCCR
jgi:hypothetical protein